MTGSDPQELAGDGVFLDHTERYEASAEFTRVWRRLLEGETVTFEGKHIHVRDAKLYFPPVQQPRLRSILADRRMWPGSGRRAGRSLSDWGEPPELVKIAGPRQSRRPWPQGALRNSPARDCARNQ